MTRAIVKASLKRLLPSLTDQNLSNTDLDDPVAVLQAIVLPDVTLQYAMLLLSVSCDLLTSLVVYCNSLMVTDCISVLASLLFSAKRNCEGELVGVLGVG